MLILVALIIHRHVLEINLLTSQVTMIQIMVLIIVKMALYRVIHLIFQAITATLQLAPQIMEEILVLILLGVRQIINLILVLIQLDVPRIEADLYFSTTFRCSTLLTQVVLVDVLLSMVQIKKQILLVKAILELKPVLEIMVMLLR